MLKNIVHPLADFLLKAPAEFAALLELYKAMLDEHGAATREHFNPMRLGKDLHNTSIFERNHDDSFTIRLVGSSLRQRIGLNPEGQDLSQSFPSQYYDVCRASFLHALKVPCGVKACYIYPYQDGQISIIESLALPIERAGSWGQIIFQSRPIEQSHSDATRLMKQLSETDYAIEWIDIGHGSGHDFDSGKYN